LLFDLTPPLSQLGQVLGDGDQILHEMTNGLFRRDFA